jgi:hypothetical protein
MCSDVHRPNGAGTAFVQHHGVTDTHFMELLLSLQQR